MTCCSPLKRRLQLFCTLLIFSFCAAYSFGQEGGPPNCCTQPLGEASTFLGYDTGATDGYYGSLFSVEVYDTEGDTFTGRQVLENLLVNGTNGCWWSGNAIGMNPTTSWTPAPPWTVGATNTYSSDAIEVLKSWTDYIFENARAHGVSFPCTMTFPTSMSMDCDGFNPPVSFSSSAFYASHTATDTFSILSSGNWQLVQCRDNTYDCGTFNFE